MNLLSRLSPDPASVRLDTWAIEPARPAITLTLRPRSRTARCPLCERRAGRVHSRYERTLADLPWGEHTVAIRLRVRRLFCDNAALPAPHLRRAPAGRRRALGAQDGAPRRPAGGDRSRAGRGRRRPTEPRPARAGRAQHPAAAGPGGALAARGRAFGPRGRRLGAAQAPQLRHRAGRPGAAPAGGLAARPRGGDPRPLAAGAPRGRDRGARPRRRLRRRHAPRRARGGAGRRPLPPAAEPGRGAGDHVHRARRGPARGRAGAASGGRRRRWSRAGRAGPAAGTSGDPGRRAPGAAHGPVPAGLGAPPRGLARPRDRPAPRPRPEHGGALPAARDLPRAQGARRRRAEPARPLEAVHPGALERRPA